MSKKTLLSGSTVTGNLTIGNYIGAVSNWVAMQEQYNCYFMVADLHALTVPQDPDILRERTRSFYAQYLACGLDPQQNTLFLQSHVSQNAELTWVLNCFTPYGQLGRMTQFKEKSEAHKDNINAGLFTYPVLMAADILLYDTDLVPVGEDQKQHLELTRDVAERFNQRYGKTFVVPNPSIAEVGARIMSLQDPTKKMSKSDENTANFIAILDDPKLITKKIKTAVTDSGSEVKYNPEKAGISNLIEMYAVLAKCSFAEVEQRFAGKMYGHLKVELAELCCQVLQPVQEKYQHYMGDKAELDRVMKAGAAKARERASSVLDRVYDKLGLVLR